MKNNNLILTNGTAYTPSGIIANASIIIEQGKIKAIYSKKTPLDIGSSQVFDVKGALICPGFIDIHNNGGGGVLVMDGKYESIKLVAQAHARNGTTSFVPTTVAWSDDEQIAAISASVEAARKGTGGSKVIGIHMEGPFLNPAKGGAHNPKYLQSPSIKQFDKFYDASQGMLKIMTLSPELPGALDLIRYIRGKGVVVSVGHTTANYNQALEAIEAGVGLCAHIMNAMPPITAREPSITTAMLTSKDTMAELITDGVHVHPALVKLVIKTKGIDHVIIVTDSTPPSGTKNATWTLEGTTVTVKGYTGYLPDGTIAGSALTMGSAVRITKEITGLSLENILPMASANAARLLGVDKSKGTLEVGKDADIVVMSDDTKMEILATIVEGELVHKGN
jgi:N-acetylglucosamine-6-phosphate deacetylase